MRLAVCPLHSKKFRNSVLLTGSINFSNCNFLLCKARGWDYVHLRFLQVLVLNGLLLGNWTHLRIYQLKATYLCMGYFYNDFTSLVLLCLLSIQRGTEDRGDNRLESVIIPEAQRAKAYLQLQAIHFLRKIWEKGKFTVNFSAYLCWVYFEW